MALSFSIIFQMPDPRATFFLSHAPLKMVIIEAPPTGFLPPTARPLGGWVRQSF